MDKLSNSNNKMTPYKFLKNNLKKKKLNENINWTKTMKKIKKICVIINTIKDIIFLCEKLEF